MKRLRFDWLNVLSWGLFAGVVAVFFVFGEIAMWRAAGVVSLIFEVRALIDRRVGFGWEGQEPSIYLTGWPAVVFITVGILLSLFLIFFAHIFVRWF